MNKVLLSFFCFLFSFFCFSQNDLISTWYLDYIVKDGVTYPNYFNDNQVFEITFTNIESGFEDYLNYNMGHGCNASNGFYTLNSNEITVGIEATTAFDCFTRPHAKYEIFFLETFVYNDFSSVYTYTITGVSNDQVLTMVNPSNGNSLVFKKQTPTTLLISTWWLHHIDIPGNQIIDIPITDIPHIIFTNDIINPLPFIPEVNGVGECESFFAKYNVSFNGANNISVSEFIETLSACASGSYEGIYFNILGNNTTNFFEYEIIDNGSTLILTDLLGAKLIFGDTTLSVEDYSKDYLNISLKQNPIDNQLGLDIDDSFLTKQIEYTIYSIDGKLIKSSILNDDTIDISSIYSGIYFIRFLENNNSQTLKFIKK